MMAIQYCNLFSTILWAAVAIITTSMLLFTQCCSKCQKKGPKAGRQPPKAIQPPKKGKGAGAKGKAVRSPASGKPKKVPTKPRMGEPKFGPIKEADGLMSYEDANIQLRRKPLPTPQLPAPAPQTPIRPLIPVVVESPVPVVGAGPKMVEQRPKENEGVVANSPDYDTLNFAREQDVFATGDKEKQREDDQPMENDNEGAEDKGVRPGMADQGDYETLAEIQKGDVFADGK